MKALPPFGPRVSMNLHCIRRGKVLTDYVSFAVDTILLQRRENVENGPHFLVPTASLIDLLYSSGDDQQEDLEHILTQKSMNNAESLKMKGPEFWLDLMNQTFTLPRVVLKGEMYLKMPVIYVI